MNYEKAKQAEQKLYDLDCAGKLDPILESDNLKSQLWDVFPEAYAIEDFNSFIRELCEEQTYESYGYINHEEVEELIRPMMDWYHPVSVTDGIDLIFLI